ncbi:MAG: hypothetical protein KIS65_08385 [Nitrosomonas sp.]|nr:hypothetical protein [Nitrosomonas sp.]MCW5619209.1 hypothetical protein [Nitrosomonas sp.]
MSVKKSIVVVTVILCILSATASAGVEETVITKEQAEAEAKKSGLPLSEYRGYILSGRYAPQGDCGKQPLIEVTPAGELSIHANGKAERIRPDIAYSYGGNYYEGIQVWLFPYHEPERPILFNFNAEEQFGRLEITAHDHGWEGGPPLSQPHQALINGSPYQRCQ